MVHCWETLRANRLSSLRADGRLPEASSRRIVGSWEIRREPRLLSSHFFFVLRLHHRSLALRGALPRWLGSPAASVSAVVCLFSAVSRSVSGHLTSLSFASAAFVVANYRGLERSIQPQPASCYPADAVTPLRTEKDSLCSTLGPERSRRDASVHHLHGRNSQSRISCVSASSAVNPG
jgi:hypothetical protein